jgi:hypothetical protein
LSSDELNAQIERFCSTETFGCKFDDDPMSAEDRRAMRILENTTRKVDDMGCSKYEVGMLWKSDDTRLPNNRTQAYKRFMSLRRRLNSNSSFRIKYIDTMSEYINSGYARKLSKDEASRHSPIDNWLPHHGVWNPNKGKLRTVLDAGASIHGVSLNSNLLKGPELTSSLVRTLMRFRNGSVAFAADIKSMFHRVKVPMSDQNALRFSVLTTLLTLRKSTRCVFISLELLILRAARNMPCVGRHWTMNNGYHRKHFTQFSEVFTSMISLWLPLLNQRRSGSLVN